MLLPQRIQHAGLVVAQILRGIVGSAYYRLVECNEA
jgi:hypothetical protein